MIEATAGLLNCVDAFSETVGLLLPYRPDTLSADCEDLNSISMGIAKQQRIGKKNILLAFDSLTPYFLIERRYSGL
ncbi:MAG: hypothetical protein ACTSP1_16230 [Candidatus Freyarchaeota archaeon]